MKQTCLIKQPRYTLQVTPYRGKQYPITTPEYKTQLIFGDDEIYINMSYGYLEDMFDDGDGPGPDTIKTELHVIEESYILKSAIKSIAKTAENLPTETDVELLHMITLILEGTVSNIRCKHVEETQELLTILYNWWKYGEFPKEQDETIVA